MANKPNPKCGFQLRGFAKKKNSQNPSLLWKWVGGSTSHSQILDGAAVVQMLNPGIAKTFLDYTVHVFCHICTRKAPLVLTLFGMYIKQN